MYNIKLTAEQLRVMNIALNEYAMIVPEKSAEVFKLLLTMAEQQSKQRESVEAFERAIAAGLLSNDPAADNFADKYMYMGTSEFSSMFKHIMTRKYIHVPI